MTNGEVKALRIRLDDLKDMKDKVSELLEVLESLRDDIEFDLDYARDTLSELNEGCKPADLDSIKEDEWEISKSELKKFDKALDECSDALAARYY